MRFAIRAAIVGIAVLTLGFLYFRSLPSDVVAVGAPVRQDDFTYTVTRVVRHRTNGLVSYVVTVRVDNEAKLVDYRWSDDIVYVTDSNGRRYLPAKPDGSAARGRTPVGAGSSAEYEITFDLPFAAEHPMLHYWNGIMMGDVFDGAAYGRAVVAL